MHAKCSFIIPHTKERILRPIHWKESNSPSSNYVFNNCYFLSHRDFLADLTNVKCRFNFICNYNIEKIYEVFLYQHISCFLNHGFPWPFFFIWWRHDVYRADFRIAAFLLLWHYNGRDGVSNHQPQDCLLNHSFRRRSKKTSQLRITGLCAGNLRWSMNSPHKWSETRKMFPFDNGIMLCKEST